MRRLSPHLHAVLLNRRCDDVGTFFYIPVSGLKSMAEVFRRMVIRLLVKRDRLNEDSARNLLS